MPPECDCSRPATSEGIYHESTCALRLLDEREGPAAKALYRMGYEAGEAHVIERMTGRLQRLGVPATESYDAAFDWLERRVAALERNQRGQA